MGGGAFEHCSNGFHSVNTPQSTVDKGSLVAILSSDFVDLTTLPCARAEALRRIYLILNDESSQGLTSDMSRWMMITDPTGATLLEVPFTDALAGCNALH